MGVKKMAAFGFVAVQFVLFALFGLALLNLPRATTTLSLQVGVLGAVFGIGLVLLAVLEHLQRNAAPPNVSPTPNDRAKLVTTGLYRFARHPIYTGVLFTAGGAAVAHGHALALAVAFVFIPFFTFKSMYEESLLRSAYPDYRAYMQRTGRFLPFL
jgi:protein-S-isoprenylcysteine O-methyltransferase Ste14